MKKDQLRNRVFVALLMLLLFGSLLRINAASPRVDVHALSAQTALPDQLVLLEGGTLKKNQLGGESLYFTLEWQDGGCLFLQKRAAALCLSTARPGTTCGTASCGCSSFRTLLRRMAGTRSRFAAAEKRWTATGAAFTLGR